MSGTAVRAQYSLRISPADHGAGFVYDTLKLQRSFSTLRACRAYVERLPTWLAAKGYTQASVDSAGYDSTSAWCVLYVGSRNGSVILRTDSIEPSLLANLGFDGKTLSQMEVAQWPLLQEKVLGYLEDNGYPFASVNIDSVALAGSDIHARLHIEKGPLYSIDSIHAGGNASISNNFLQHYLGIREGSTYSKAKLKQISGRIRELPFLREKQPWDLTMLGTGSVLNLYLDSKKSSEVNVLVGLLPSNDQLLNNRMLVTGEANINLKNSLGNGETIGVNWQQIQVKSPRLNLLFLQPYLFRSPFGMNLNFDLFKKDSSFINISMLAGVSYAVSSRQSGSVFLQRLTTNLLTVDTNAVKSSRRLPPEADLSSVNLGVSYDWLTTDYRFNPRKGNEWSLSASVGTKAIRKNNVIAKLYDNADPAYNFGSLYDTFRLKSYQFRLRGRAVRYFPLGRATVIKTALQGGWFQSPNIFRNELFQIGGYKLLRGFDEESIFTSAFGVATAEYRYLIGQNSFLLAFMDYGVTGNRLEGKRLNNRFLGAGIGMAFETRAGVFNISYASGKRDDEPFNLRQSKIHLGYVNYF